MKPKVSEGLRRDQKLKRIEGDGPNWVLFAGGALLSTLSVRLGIKLKQAFDKKRANNGFKENGNFEEQNRSEGSCMLHSGSLYFAQNEGKCYHCISGHRIINQTPSTPTLKEDLNLPLVKVSSSSESLSCSGFPMELPRKPFHHSNGSESPCISESGTDFYSKRDVIQKLRYQLKSRDEMILEMHARTSDLQNSLSMEMNESAQLRTQIDSANRDLFQAEREIQRLRKVIACHCLSESGALGELELRCVVLDKGGGGNIEDERVELLRREVRELKEVVKRKEFLLQSYKEKKMEELQLKLSQQVPSIL